VNGKCLKKVIEYCRYHVKDEPDEIQKPLKSPNISEIVCEFDAKYIDIDDLEQIFEIIAAAHYLLI